MSLFSFQGRVHIGTRLVTGKPGILGWVGNVSEASLSLSSESEVVKESFTGKRLPYATIDTGNGGALTLTLTEWFTKVLALGLYSTPVDVVAGAVAAAGEAFPPGLVAGDQVRLAHPHASAIAMVDSAGSPAAVAGTKYRLQGHNGSIVEMLDVAGFTQPFKVGYSYEAVTGLEVFTQPAPERYVLFDGVNTVTDEKVLIDIYRVKFAPFSDVGLIHAGAGNLAMQGTVLYDELNLDGNGKGGFYRIRQKTAA